MNLMIAQYCYHDTGEARARTQIQPAPALHFLWAKQQQLGAIDDMPRPDMLCAGFLNQILQQHFFREQGEKKFELLPCFT